MLNDKKVLKNQSFTSKLDKNLKKSVKYGALLGFGISTALFIKIANFSKMSAAIEMLGCSSIGVAFGGIFGLVLYSPHKKSQVFLPKLQNVAQKYHTIHKKKMIKKQKIISKTKHI